MIEWPPDVRIPAIDRVYRLARNLCGPDCWGAAMARMATAIFVADVYRPNRLHTWGSAESAIGVRRQTLETAYRRSRRRPIVRRMAFSMLNTLIVEQRIKRKRGAA